MFLYYPYKQTTMLDVLLDEHCWPEGFCGIGGRTFLWVFNNKKDWVEFTLDKMKDPTGLFLEWKNYCTQKLKEEIKCQSIS